MHSEMRLYNPERRRLYVNAEERASFLEIANKQPTHIRAFCLLLLYTGCRLSEARELTKWSLQNDAGIVAICSLKKRSRYHIREVPVPRSLVELVLSLPGETLWEVDRVTAYRWVKTVMVDAGIDGAQACPKGLRHGFGVHAIRCGIQINMLQKWMGHASIKTTAIYANAVGQEEREIARRMWEDQS